VAWLGAPVFAFGIPGLKEIVLVGLVALALYGRNGSRLLMATRYGRSLQPWMRLVGVVPRARPTPHASTRPAPRRRGRLFWALTLMAAAAVAAWVATRMVILSGSGSH